MLSQRLPENRIYTTKINYNFIELMDHERVNKFNFEGKFTKETSECTDINEDLLIRCFFKVENFKVCARRTIVARTCTEFFIIIDLSESNFASAPSFSKNSAHI